MRTTLLLIAATTCTAWANAQDDYARGGTLAREDSLMNAAREMADMGNFSEAINIYSQVPTERARIERTQAYLEMGNVVRALSDAKLMGREKDFGLKDDALLIEARCRERQGFVEAARRMYRRLMRKGHAEGMYYYASHLHSIGHQAKAAEVCQKAIKANRQLTPAHELMADIETARGHRYQALLPLMRYMLTASDNGRQAAAERLMRLWRRGGLGIDILSKREAEEKYSEMMEKRIDAICDSIRPKGETSADKIDALAMRTDSLLAVMRETGEENLDFWQVEYADFLIEIHARGFTRPMIYFIMEPAYRAECLAWLSENAGYFLEFETWVNGRL